jgi:hypothetical protein
MNLRSTQYNIYFCFGWKQSLFPFVGHCQLRDVLLRLDARRLLALDLFGYCTVPTLCRMYGPIENLACASLANTRHNLYYLLCGVIDAIVFIALCIQFVPYSSEFSSLLRISVL